MKRALPHTLADSLHTYQKPTSPTCRGPPSQGRRCGETETMEWQVSLPPALTPFHPPHFYPISRASDPVICDLFLSPNPVTGLGTPGNHLPLHQACLLTLSLVSRDPSGLSDWFPWHSLPLFLFSHFLQELFSSGSFL